MCIYAGNICISAGNVKKTLPENFKDVEQMDAALKIFFIYIFKQKTK